MTCKHDWNYNDAVCPIYSHAENERLTAEIDRLRAALTKGHYLAQAARRAVRDIGGDKTLDLNAAAAEFQAAYDAEHGNEQKGPTTKEG